MVGSGKTSLARSLATQTNALFLCPDAWIPGLMQDSGNRAEADRLREPVESLQWELARTLLARGTSIILDNGFWSREERLSYRDGAAAVGARVELHYLDVSRDELWRRVQARNRSIDVGAFVVQENEIDIWMGWFTPPDREEAGRYDNFVHHRA